MKLSKISKDNIKGGLAQNTPDTDYPQDQIEQGIKVEKEHTTDKKIAKEIAKDHLKENPKYYTELKKIEKH